MVKTTDLPVKHYSIKQRDVCLKSGPKEDKRTDEEHRHGKGSLQVENLDFSLNKNDRLFTTEDEAGRRMLHKGKQNK